MIDYKKHKSNFSPYLEKLYQSDKPMIIYKLYKAYLSYVFLLIDFVYSIYSVFNLKTGSSLIGKWIIAAKTDNAIAKYHA